MGMQREKGKTIARGKEGAKDNETRRKWRREKKSQKIR